MASAGRMLIPTLTMMEALTGPSDDGLVSVALGPVVQLRGRHAPGRDVQQMGRLARPVRQPLADGPATLDQGHLDGLPRLPGTSKNLGRGHGATEAPANHDDGWRAARLGLRADIHGRPG